METPKLKAVKFTLHTDDECKSPSILTIQLRVNWGAVSKSHPDALEVTINNIYKAMVILTEWKEYLEIQKHKNDTF